ncbi:molybdate ABC transporter substrate-binding protein [Laspinema olomoucense]|uniref:molybdate ABC transporter substrate-binding protein n=1 Tax=Laspinema olomoucense TaxID=3231600 RepID=UPI0021BB7CCB|nr:MULTISPECIES: molybdate ABC transporter substrate-binding protein [unclassified Laspinema]MCT7989575.1 molybdate ABC transporter substrate-binding protein [Laspinema sp. D3a]MCT7994016.1 molybdate ABC transporter substrate-binding protein [Laspinema sp. D3c]
MGQHGRKPLRYVVYALLLLLVACGRSPGTQPPSSSSASVTLTVSAAASLNQVLPPIAKLWEQETGNKVIINLGSTGQLAQQIERGAPVDLFVAADTKSIEDLDKKQLVFSETKALYGVGRITLWHREDSSLQIKELQDLTRAEIERVAIANPDHAPYGIAAKQALESIEIWEELQPKLVLGENIRQTQHYAEAGNVDVAIVALSLSLNRPGQWSLIPDNLHQPIEKMLVVPKTAHNPDNAQQFARFINSSKSRPLMQKHGFILPGEEPVK